MPTLPTKAIKGLIQKNGKILLLQRQKKPGDTANWDLPGGLCEPGETEVDALKREIQEELIIAAN
jgi:8-oxo-dGTP diphosphatase